MTQYMPDIRFNVFDRFCSETYYAAVYPENYKIHVKFHHNDKYDHELRKINQIRSAINNEMRRFT